MQAAIAAYSIHHNTNDCVDWLVEMTKWTRDLPIISQNQLQLITGALQLFMKATEISATLI